MGTCSEVMSSWVEVTATFFPQFRHLPAPASSCDAQLVDEPQYAECDLVDDGHGIAHQR